MPRRSSFVAACLAWAVAGCEVADNYLDPDGPRYAGDYVSSPPPVGDELLVVTYNLEYAIEIDRAIEVLREPPLAGADIILMQEMDGDGTDRIAAALGLRYVYYPGSIHHHGRDFGTAILTPHPLVADHKLLLPYADPINGRRRIATAATIDLAGVEVVAYSVHTSVVSLGLGARLEQAETSIDDAPVGGPLVIAGDFNTGDPGSVDQTVEMFADRGLAWTTADTDDTCELAGVGFLLDFIFARELPGRSAGVLAGDAGSDHQPVWARLATPVQP